MAKDSGMKNDYSDIPDETIPPIIRKCLNRAYREHETNKHAVTKKIFTFPNTPVILLVEINDHDRRLYVSPQDQRNSEWSNLEESTYSKYLVTCPLELSESEILWIERCNKQVH